MATALAAWGAARRPADEARRPTAARPGLRFGTYLAPGMIKVYEAISDQVGRELGCTTELTVEADYGAFVTDVNDVCFVCSLPYVTYQRCGIDLATPVAAPVLQGERYQGFPICFSDVVVRADSSFRSFEDLRGHSWAFNEPLSQSGYGITRYTMLRRGLTGGFFGKVVQAGFHDTAIGMVVAGSVDGAAIDSQVLEIKSRDHPELARRLRVVDVFGPSTIQPVAVSKRLGPGVRERIRDVLVNLHEDPAMQATLAEGFIERFVPVGPEDYDDVRAMVAACEAAGFMELR